VVKLPVGHGVRGRRQNSGFRFQCSGFRYKHSEFKCSLCFFLPDPPPAEHPKPDTSRFVVWDCGFVKGSRHRAQGNLGHLPSASLGHYASLSFVVRGRGERMEDRRQLYSTLCPMLFALCEFLLSTDYWIF